MFVNNSQFPDQLVNKCSDFHLAEGGYPYNKKWAVITEGRFTGHSSQCDFIGFLRSL